MFIIYIYSINILFGSSLRIIQWGDTHHTYFISVAPCTEGWPQWYRVAESSWWCPEKWETKRTSRWTGNGSTARVPATWCESSINTTSSLASWDKEWIRRSLSLGISSQVHWIARNIWQVPFDLHLCYKFEESKTSHRYHLCYKIYSLTCWQLKMCTRSIISLCHLYLSQPPLSRVSFILQNKL